MAHWCDSCGQELPEGEVHRSANWLGELEPEHRGPRSRPSGPRSSARDRKIVFGLVGLLAAWGALIGIGRLIAPDDTIDEQAAAEIEEREAADAAAAERAGGGADPADGTDAPDIADAEPNLTDEQLDPERTVDGDTPLPQSTNVSDGVAPSVQVERLGRQLDRRGSTAAIAYASAEGIVLVDLASGTARLDRIDAAESTTVHPGAALLRSGPITYAIDPVTTLVSQVGQSSALIVADAADDNTYFVGAQALSGQSGTIEVSAAGARSTHQMPAGGFQLLAADGLGLLAVPKGPTGETLIAGEQSFSPFSEHRVVTANRNAALEQVCQAEQPCVLLVREIESDDSWEVPSEFVRFGDNYLVSPDGDNLLRFTPEGFAEVVAADSESISWVTGAGMERPAWGPDSNFIVWLDRVGEPKIKVMFRDERDWLSVDLADLGAPAPTGPEIAVFVPGEDIVTPSAEAS